jgi:hypothetical protein
MRLLRGNPAACRARRLYAASLFGTGMESNLLIHAVSMTAKYLIIINFLFWNYEF